jgi:FKBP-type peptidyl-prolyl cis-trans isomerase (trigger factor)
VRPEIPIVLADHAKRLLERIMPQLTGFDANSVAMMSFMLTMIAEEWDRSAAWRIEENVAIRALFQAASPVVADAGLAKRLETLAAGTDSDFHIKELDKSNNELREALTALHAHVENLRTAEAKKVDESIWAELRRSVQRRRVGLANF